MALEQGITVTPTAARLDALAERMILSEALCNDLKSALAYFMEVRLRSQLRAMRTGRHEEEAIVHLHELSSRDRDLLREALKVVKRFKDVVRSRYHLAQL
jgi:CBS domain-containing protein